MIPPLRESMLPRSLLIVIALVTLAGCSSPSARNPQSAERPPAVTALTPLAPKGAVRWPFEFSWSGTGGPDCIYRVKVVDAADRHLIEFQTRETHVAAPDELRPMLGGSQPFYWHVSVDGSHASTPPTEFRLK